MLFAVGTKVKFLHTGDEGVVKGLIEGGMVNVFLPQLDMEIPAFPEDLVRAEEFLKHPVKAKIVGGKKDPTPMPPPPIAIQTQYTILKSNGIQLAFDPISGKDGLTEKFVIYLLNDTKYDVIYSIQSQANYRRPLIWENNLKGLSYIQLGEMPYDDLNEAPGFEVECRWISTEGIGAPVSKSLKLKAKSFFNNMRTAPFLNRQVYLYRLFEKPQQEEETHKEEDLSSYTKRNSKPVRWSRPDAQNLAIYDSKGLAEFNPEIDLHIEKLTDDWRKLSNAEILRMQIAHFEAYINKAIRLGVARVFIIHGVGEGRLRDEVATQLMKYEEVQTFKNEYHHRYGWGATEVIF